MQRKHDSVGALRREIYFILLLACVVRLLAVWHWRGISTQLGDQSEYIALAQNVRFYAAFSYGENHPWGAPGHLNTSGPFTPTAARAPLYPMTIAALKERPASISAKIFWASSAQACIIVY